MELKVKLPSILNPKDYLCTHPSKTLSFRSSSDLFATLNSAFADTPFSLDTASSSSSSSNVVVESSNDGGDIDEAVILGAYSETTRLSFDPSPTKSLLPARVVEVVMESNDPYSDFSNSVEEIVLAHRWIIDDWDSLEELLAWYLGVNDTHNHRYVVGAFMDVLVKYSLPPKGCGGGGVGGNGGH